MCERDSMEGNVTLKTLKRDINLGSTSFLPPPACRYIRESFLHVLYMYIG